MIRPWRTSKMLGAWSRGVAVGLWFGWNVHAAAAQPPSQGGSEETDWTVLIAKLRQDVYERPEHAQTRKQLAVAYNNYGVSLGNQRRWQLAEQQLQEALRWDAENTQFRLNLSSVYFNQAHEAYEQHRTADVRAAIRQALALNPNLAQAYVLLGDLEYEQQNLKEARAAWQRAASLDPAAQGTVLERLQRVTQELPVESKFDRLSQAYFDLRYEEQFERPVGFDVRDALLEARRLVGSDFAYWPRHRIVVLVYSAENFRRLRQEMPDWVAGQFDGKIRVPLPGGEVDSATVKQILFHEYTHAVVNDLTAGRCPTWLNEGLAEYEGRRQLPGLPVQLAGAVTAGRLIPWTELSNKFSMMLPLDDVALGYQEAQSIVAYLIQRYGIWRVRRVLRGVAAGQPWEAALSEEFHTKLPALEANWRQWLPEFLRSAP